jgi:Na+/phosphate symporter
MSLSTACAFIAIGQQCQTPSFQTQLALVTVNQLVASAKQKSKETTEFSNTRFESQQKLLDLIDKNIAKAQVAGDVKLMDRLIARRQKLLAQNERLLLPRKDQ